VDFPIFGGQLGKNPLLKGVPQRIFFGESGEKIGVWRRNTNFLQTVGENIPRDG